MRGFLVSCGCFDVPVGLDQGEPGGVLEVLDHVEPGDAGFPERGCGIGARGLDEGGDVFRQDPDLDMDDQHGGEGSVVAPLTGPTRVLGQHPGFVPGDRSGLDWRES